MMERDTKSYVAGHRGMVGSAIVRILQGQGQSHLITRSHAELDLTDQAAVRQFFASEKPEQTIMICSATIRASTTTRST